VKHFDELEKQHSQLFLPCWNNEYQIWRFHHSLKLLTTSSLNSIVPLVSLGIKTTSWKLSCRKSMTAPPSFSTINIFNKTVDNMPRTSSASATSSSRCSNDSEHFPYCYVNLEHIMNTFSQRENVATAINLAHNDRMAFTEIAFLDYLFQNIRRKEIQLEKDKRLA
jgi:hypothetical protein